MRDSTIAAVVTPFGIGGVGIIKISGAKSFSIGEKIFIPKKNKKSFIVETHKLYYGYIYDHKEKKSIDEVLICFMKAPNTYTTENVVEIQAHSSFFSLNKILDLVINEGAKIAGPGEFTKRAFLAGRIDLTQAEATINLINAKNEKSALYAMDSLKGTTKSILEELRYKMLKMQADYEFIIEFSNKKENSKLKIANLCLLVKEVIPKIKFFIRKEKRKNLFSKGIKIIISGAPNVGKSTLMNRLAKEDVSITSNISGTTRDIIKNNIFIRSLPIKIFDSAGLCDTKNSVEKIGIKKTIEYIKSSDIVLLVMDNKSQIELLKKSIFKENIGKIILVLNKVDKYNFGNLAFFKKNKKFNYIRISAKNGKKVNKLKELILKKIVIDGMFDSFSPYEQTLKNRQYYLFKKMKVIIYKLLRSIKKEVSADLLSLQISDCLNTIDEILGYRENKQLYNYIFNKFCVGK